MARLRRTRRYGARSLDAILAAGASDEEREARYQMREREAYELEQREQRGERVRGPRQRMDPESEERRVRRPWPMLPTLTFRVMCPATARQRKQQVGVGFTLPHDFANPEGGTMACLDVFESPRRRGKNPGCREFPTQELAMKWMAVAAEDVEC